MRRFNITNETNLHKQVLFGVDQPGRDWARKAEGSQLQSWVETQFGRCAANIQVPGGGAKESRIKI